MSIWACQRLRGEPALGGRAGKSVYGHAGRVALGMMAVLLAATGMPAGAQKRSAQTAQNGSSSEGPTSGAKAPVDTTRLAARLKSRPDTKLSLSADSQSQSGRAAPLRANLPPRVVQAQRFLAERGFAPGRAPARGLRKRAKTAVSQAQPQSTGVATWLPLGPVAVESQNFGLVTGRWEGL